METVLKISILISLNCFLSLVFSLNRETGTFLYIGILLKAWRKTVMKNSECFNKFSSWLKESSFGVKREKEKRQADKEVQMRS